jgi:hypothetical protein
MLAMGSIYSLLALAPNTVATRNGTNASRQPENLAEDGSHLGVCHLLEQAPESRTLSNTYEARAMRRRSDGVGCSAALRLRRVAAYDGETTVFLHLSPQPRCVRRAPIAT